MFEFSVSDKSYSLYPTECADGISTEIYSAALEDAVSTFSSIYEFFINRNCSLAIKLQNFSNHTFDRVFRCTCHSEEEFNAEIKSSYNVTDIRFYCNISNVLSDIIHYVNSCKQKDSYDLKCPVYAYVSYKDSKYVNVAIWIPSSVKEK